MIVVGLAAARGVACDDDHGRSLHLGSRKYEPAEANAGTFHHAERGTAAKLQTDRNGDALVLAGARDHGNLSATLEGANDRREAAVRQIHAGIDVGSHSTPQEGCRHFVRASGHWPSRKLSGWSPVAERCGDQVYHDVAREILFLIER